MNIVQRTSLTFLQQDYLELLIEGFLIAKKSENVASGTLKFYKDKLALFNTYCLSQEIKQVSQIAPNTIREFLLFLRERQ
jgi:site-specific recombinase XerD